MPGVDDDQERALPQLLRQVLDQADMAQAELARRADLSPKHVNLLCRGTARLSVDVALRLEFVLGVPAEEWLRAAAAGECAEQRPVAVDRVVRARLRQLTERAVRAEVEVELLRQELAAKDAEAAR